jgi:phosphonate transport system ATP-binding protein
VQAELLIADEPIASLDPASARRVMDILADMNRRDGITILVSLHQVEYALSYCPRTIALKAGKIVYDGPSAVLTPALLCSIYGAEVSELFSHSIGPPTPERRQANGPPRPRTQRTSTPDASHSAQRVLCQRPPAP